MRNIEGILVRASLAAALFAAAIGGAQSSTRFDGTWTVAISAGPGCGGGSSFMLTVHNGIVSGAFNAHGRVTDKGAVQVSVSSGSQSGSGSGRLSGSSGSGSWRGNGSQGPCSGSWTASR